MKLNITKEVTALEQMTVGQLRAAAHHPPSESSNRSARAFRALAHHSFSANILPP